MTPQVAILLTVLCWTCCQSTLAWQLCDNGKVQVGRDLPHLAGLHCSEPLLKDSSQQLHIVQKYSPPLRTAKHVCMDTPISYNATIPSSGDHRPVEAEPGVYLYCPTQRWLNNLQHGAIVVLHHPCAPDGQRGRLAALARSCLPGSIMTAHPWLSPQRPLALVSWGRTLEMSHVSAPEVCDWLVSVSSNPQQHHNPDQRRRRERYSLLLIHRAPLHRPKETAPDMRATTSRIDWLKSLRTCCEQTLSPHHDGETQEGEEDEGIRRRERRAVLRGQEKDHHQDSMKTEFHTRLQNETGLHSPQPSRISETVTHATGLLVNSTAKTPTATVTANPSKGRKNPVGEGEPKKEEATRTENQGSQRGGGGGGGGGEEEQRKATGMSRTRSRVHSSHSHSRGQTHRKAGESGATSPRQRVREDTEEQRRLGELELEWEWERETEAPAGAGKGSLGDRLPTARTDEAVWAAAALGFLLVLLTLSVLHTRLYRHWRTTPSLYWRDGTQDYDSVADVIRRRLKLAGRRKRRVAAGRRQEAPLIPNSSTEEESD